MKESSQSIQKIVNGIKSGQVGIFPCDTVLGIIGLVTLENIKRIRAIKKRGDSPFLLLIPSQKWLESLTEGLSESQRMYCNQYWPGPITFIFEKSAQIPDELTEYKESIAIRCPQFEPLNTILDAVNAPLISYLRVRIADIE
jgi:L-threonylcarbamoyladenylate synthase